MFKQRFEWHTLLQHLRWVSWISLLSVTLSACGDRGTALEGRSVGNLAFNLYSTDMGIHPSKSVLNDPNNPFADVPIDELNNGTPEAPAEKWVISQAAPTVVAFYAWAT